MSLHQWKPARTDSQLNLRVDFIYNINRIYTELFTGSSLDPVREFFNIPEERGILFGMSFGYADETAAVNTTRTEREPIENSVVFRG